MVIATTDDLIEEKRYEIGAEIGAHGVIQKLEINGVWCDDASDIDGLFAIERQPDGTYKVTEPLSLKGMLGGNQSKTETKSAIEALTLTAHRLSTTAPTCVFNMNIKDASNRDYALHRAGGSTIKNGNEGPAVIKEGINAGICTLLEHIEANLEVLPEQQDERINSAKNQIHASTAKLGAKSLFGPQR